MTLSVPDQPAMVEVQSLSEHLHLLQGHVFTSRIDGLCVCVCVCVCVCTHTEWSPSLWTSLHCVTLLPLSPPLSSPPPPLDRDTQQSHTHTHTHARTHTHTPLVCTVISIPLSSSAIPFKYQSIASALSPGVYNRAGRTAQLHAQCMNIPSPGSCRHSNRCQGKAHDSNWNYYG